MLVCEICKMSSKSELAGIEAIHSQIKFQVSNGFAIHPPCVYLHRSYDVAYNFIGQVQLIVNYTCDRAFFMENPRFDGFLFYARLYRAALECINGTQNGTDIRRLLVNIEKDMNIGDMLPYLCALDDAMIVAGIYL